MIFIDYKILKQKYHIYSQKFFLKKICWLRFGKSVLVPWTHGVLIKDIHWVGVANLFIPLKASDPLLPEMCLQRAGCRLFNTQKRHTRTYTRETNGVFWWKVGISKKKGYYAVTVGLTVMAHHYSTGIRVARTSFGALSVAVIVIGAHACITSYSLTWKGTERYYIRKSQLYMHILSGWKTSTA